MDYCRSGGLSSKGVMATREAPIRGAGSRLRTQSAVAPIFPAEGGEVGMRHACPASSAGGEGPLLPH
jgi:hypothetical protein